ncbi:MAG: RNA polymerase sigma factor [Ktedonobacteraceae bacterium]
MQVQESLQAQRQALTDGVLAQEALVGNQWAFEMLVHRYSTPLFSFIFHYLGDYDQAGDILQQVFLQLYLSLPTLHTSEPLKPWLYRVARNRCLDDIRQKQRRRTIHFSELETAIDEDDALVLTNIPDPRPLPEEQAEHHDLQSHLRQAIQTLPPRFRAVVYLRYAAQLSFAEIAQALNMPTATAKTYFQRAKPLLAVYLQNYTVQNKV